jgi:S-adenosylmethionine-diacylgycerolhomoserine-N-methlytransferase
MDRIYRSQRHIYDLTRRYFLLGRDTLIERLDISDGDRVLEVGCGTARNLIKIAQRYPSVELFGVDASEEMLKTAQRNLARAGIGDRVRLERCLAEELSHDAHFGLTEPFDAVIFSYSLSMIPDRRTATDRGLVNLKPGCSMWVVDFWDQQDLPAMCAALLKRWLRLFHVQHRPELLDYFRDLEAAGSVTLAIEPLYRRYAYLAKLTKIS